ncbi:unnamed protein product [Urochloa humidicola]
MRQMRRRQQWTSAVPRRGVWVTAHLEAATGLKMKLRCDDMPDWRRRSPSAIPNGCHFDYFRIRSYSEGSAICQYISIGLNTLDKNGVIFDKTADETAAPG